MTFFVISVLTLNIILWIVLLIRFKRLFSTDKIIEKTEEKLNHLIKEIDMAADRDTFLAKETSKRIKSQVEDAEQKMELFKEATSRLRDMIAEADKINRGQKYTIQPAADYDQAYELSLKNSKPQQGNLFENSDTYSNTKSKKSNVKENPPPKENEDKHEVPLIITKVYDDQSTGLSESEKKKNLSMKVRRLFSEGMSAQDISKKLNCSITEIQFIIDLL